MIHTNRIVTVGEQESIIDRPIVLYRGDREVEIEFTLVGNEFTFSEDGNVIKSVNASHGQLVLNTPSGEHMFSELAECHEGKVVFVVTKEMIDEFVEMGFYSFQIRLYDSAEMKSRVTIPPVMNGFDIRNPIAAEDETNVVDQGIVDYARIFKDQSNEELPTFDWTGAYNKTEWEHHDVITENKLNKIEDALYSINANIKESDVVMLNALDNVKKDADKYVKEHMAEVEAEVDEFERNLNTGVEKFKVDTNAAMTAHKNEVSEVVDGFGSQLEDNVNELNALKNIKINVKDFGAKGDGVTDDTYAIQEAINFCYNTKKSSTVIIPSGTFIFTSITVKEGITLEGNGGTLKLKDNVCIDDSVGYFLIHNSAGKLSTPFEPYNNITLRNLIIDGNKENNKYYKVADCITVAGDNITVDGCAVINPPDSGIMFTNVTNSKCANNRIDKARDLGIYVNDGDGTTFKNNIISNNIISNCHYGGIGLKRSCKHAIISNNIISYCGNGITLEHASTETSNDFSHNLTITNNRLYNIGVLESQLNDGKCAKMGIVIRGGGFSIVTNNRIESVINYCISIEGSSYNIVSDNIIEGNRDIGHVEYNTGIYLKTRSHDEGVELSNFNKISNNIIKDCNRHGININPEGQTFKMNELLNNTITNTRSAGIRLTNGVTDSVVNGNIRTDDIQVLLEIQNDVTNTKIFDNIGGYSGSPLINGLNYLYKNYNKIYTSCDTKPTAITFAPIGTVCLNTSQSIVYGWIWDGTTWNEI